MGTKNDAITIDESEIEAVVVYITRPSRFGITVKSIRRLEQT